MIRYAEYDPLEPNRRSIKARVTQLCDPCSRVLDKRVEENALLSAGEGKQTLCRVDSRSRAES